MRWNWSIEGQKQSAHDLYVKGHEVSPKYSDITVGLARTEMSVGKIREAKKLILEALERTPDNPDALLAAGIILARAGDRAAARKYLQHGVEVSPDYDELRDALASLGGVGEEVQTKDPLMTVLSLALRFGVTVTFLMTSLWGLLAYVPFTYQQVHKGKLMPALNAFGQAQPVIYWGLLVAVWRSSSAWSRCPPAGCSGARCGCARSSGISTFHLESCSRCIRFSG